jgi:predicted transcriptional regulator
MRKHPHARLMALQARSTKIANLYCEGKGQATIAALLGLSQSTVSRDLAVVREEWQVIRRDVLDGRLAEELAKIDHLERVAWEAWKSSCEDSEVRSVRKVGNKEITEYVRRSRVGDPRFLERVSWCIDARCRLLGLHAAKSMYVTGTIETVQLTEAEKQVAFERIIAEMTRETAELAASAAPPEPSPIVGGINAAEPPLP